MIREIARDEKGKSSITFVSVWKITKDCFTMTQIRILYYFREFSSRLKRENVLRRYSSRYTDERRLKCEYVRDHRTHVRKFASLFTWRNKHYSHVARMTATQRRGLHIARRVYAFCNPRLDVPRRGAGARERRACRKRGWFRSSPRKRAGVDSFRRRVPISSPSPCTVQGAVHARAAISGHVSIRMQ